MEGLENPGGRDLSVAASDGQGAPLTQVAHVEVAHRAGVLVARSLAPQALDSVRLEAPELPLQPGEPLPGGGHEHGLREVVPDVDEKTPRGPR